MDAMVDAAAGSVLSIVLELSKGLYKEVNFLKGVEVGIQDLKNHLRHMKAALEVADSRLEMNKVYLEWVSDVQELAYDAEDIIDTFVHTSGSWRRNPLRRFSRRTHKLGCQLESLKEDAEKIQRWRAHYADKSITTDRRKKLEISKERREDSSLYDDTIREPMVGLEDTINFLANKLTSGGSDRHFAMSIFGMGGLGKTTLARRLYNKLSKGVHFEVRAWIFVSKEADAKKMLQQLIKEIIKPEEERKKLLEDLSTSRHSVTDYLYNYLRERSFLVVLDDVWDIQAWEDIRRAFPHGNPDSRIIITTREEDVAKMNGAYAHKLEHLNPEESWLLFCRKSFRYGNGLTECPPYLKNVGKDMVSKCDGLPLALVTLGGLLSGKSPEISEWEAVKVNLWDELKKHSRHIDAVLTFSYMDLDYNLKRCFLCLGMYPEDSEISIFELMMLWEAEGLIGQGEGRPEDIANNYFKELVSKSLLQEVRHSWNPPEYCRIHDLLRDLAITKAEEIRFSAVGDATQLSGLLNKAQPVRRLAMSYHHPNTIPLDYTNGRLRTFRLREEVAEVGQSSVSSYISVDKLLQSIDERFNLLRVLDIEVQGSITKLQLGKMIHLKYLGIKCASVELPKSIGNMIHLKYLGIKCHSVKLPKTIGNLKALQTISISHNTYYSPAFIHVNLPKTMVNLQNLKHMDVCYFDCEGDWIGKLRSLETLELIKSSKWCEIDASDLVNLRRLRISCSPGVTPRFHLNFRGKTKLRTLFLVDGVARDLPPGFLSNIFENCPSITHFTSRLRYENANNRDMLKFAKKLIHLDLRLYHIDDILMIPPTERFAELRYLKLWIMCRCTMIVMTCSEDGFPQLQTLIIDFGTDYERTTDAHLNLEVAEGGMPSLTTLQVNLRERLTVPERLAEKLIITA